MPETVVRDDDRTALEAKHRVLLRSFAHRLEGEFGHLLTHVVRGRP